MPRSALIVDSGLRNLGGHNYTYTSAVVRELRGRGWRVEVVASARLESALADATGFRPLLSLGAYDFPPSRGRLRDLAYLHAQAVVHAEELETTLRGIGAADFDLVFSPTLGDFELLAWPRVVRRLPLRGKLLLLLRNTPGYAQMDPWRIRMRPLLGLRPRALRRLHALTDGRFALLTDSELLTRDYARVFGGRVVTVPIPVGERILARPPDPDAQPATPLVFGYLGDARHAKGFDLLPELISQALEETGAVAFLVQAVAPASSASGDLDPAADALQALAREAPERVRLVRQRLDEEEYASLLSQMDVVLIPYRREGYVEPTSGIFVEALALAKPVVVPRGTWMSHCLGGSGAGLTFEPGDVRDLARAVREAGEGWPELRAAALRFAPSWRDTHNPARLAEALIRECDN
jgi:glycosyltransferase involved in cell wall biosynthesis